MQWKLLERAAILSRNDVAIWRSGDFFSPKSTMTIVAIIHDEVIVLP
jgi:hypothetical protein